MFQAPQCTSLVVPHEGAASMTEEMKQRVDSAPTCLCPTRGLHKSGTGPQPRGPVVKMLEHVSFACCVLTLPRLPGSGSDCDWELIEPFGVLTKSAKRLGDLSVVQHGLGAGAWGVVGGIGVQCAHTWRPLCHLGDWWAGLVAFGPRFVEVA